MEDELHRHPNLDTEGTLPHLQVSFTKQAVKHIKVPHSILVSCPLDHERSEVHPNWELPFNQVTAFAIPASLPHVSPCTKRNPQNYRLTTQIVL